MPSLDFRSFKNAVDSIDNYFHVINLSSGFVSLVINLFHILILSRKDMRTSSTNVLMIGIAFSDICTMLTIIYKYYFMVDVQNPECVTSTTRYKIYTDMLVWGFQDYFRRCSSWLGVLMATTRYLILRKTNADNNWSKPFMGWILMAVVLCLSAILSSFYLSRNEVLEYRSFPLPIICIEYQDIDSRPPFSVTLTPFFTINNQIVFRIYVMLDAIISKFIPCICYPTLTVFLLRQLRKLRNSGVSNSRVSSGLRDEKMGLTTKLIVFTTIAFFIAEAPLGMIYLVKAFYNRNDNIYIFSVNIIICFNVLLTVHSFTHGIFCVFMSSQYRDAIRHLFRRQRYFTSIIAKNKTSPGNEVKGA